MSHPYVSWEEIIDGEVVTLANSASNINIKYHIDCYRRVTTMSKLGNNIFSFVLYTQDPSVRQALIDLGWGPPKVLE